MSFRRLANIGLIKTTNFHKKTNQQIKKDPIKQPRGINGGFVSFVSSW